jgi:hypothetical protein
VATPATKAIAPPPRVELIPTPAPRDNQPHVIPDDNGIASPQLQPSHNQLPPNTAHLIPQDNEQPPRVPQYGHPHKYNTRAAASCFQCFPNLANAIINESTGEAYKYKQLITGTITGHTKATWSTSFPNKIGRLALGIGSRLSKGTNTIFFVKKSQVPAYRKVTYGRIVCLFCPQEEETHSTRLSVGGNLIDYPFDVSTPTAGITTIEELGHPQPPTPIKTDNSTACGIANNTLKQCKSRSMDMRFYWVHNQAAQHQFIIYWKPGTENLCDYFTKHFPASHHRLMQSTYLVPTADSSKYAFNQSPRILQGCVNSSTLPRVRAHTKAQQQRVILDSRMQQC